MQCNDLLLRIADEHQSSSLKLRRLYDSTRALDKRLSCKGALRRIFKTCANEPVITRQLYSSAKSLNASASETDPAKSLYKFAFEEVGHYWKELGASLGVRMAELTDVEEHHAIRGLNVKFMAWDMLEKYRAANGQELSSTERLRTKLREVQRLRKADILRGDRTIGDILPSCIVDDRRFYGRDDELKKIARYLWNGKEKTSRTEPLDSQKIQIVSGVGGVGKTTLAFKYVCQYAESYSDGVFYFNAESYPSLHWSLRENIIRAADFSSSVCSAVNSISDALRYFHGYLRSHPRSFLLFDNADELDLAQEFLPGPLAACCHIIITTRKAPARDIAYQRNVESLSLTSLKKEKAVVALLCWSGKSEESLQDLEYNERKYAEKVATEPPVEGLPLALSHAGTFIEKHKISFLMYWRKIEAEAKRLEAAALNLDSFLRYFHLSHLKEDLKMHHRVSNFIQFIRLDPRNIGNHYDQKSVLGAQLAYKEREKHRVFLTWELDINDVREDDSQESYLFLKCSSVMSSRDIPQDVVADAAFPCETSSLDKRFKAAKAIVTLNERSLIQQVSDPDNDMNVTFSMHHLIQASVLQRIGVNMTEFRSILMLVTNALFKRLPPLEDLDKHVTSPTLLSLTPHIYATVEKMLRVGMLDEACSGFIDYCCFLAIALLHHEDGKRLCSLRIEIFEANIANFSEEEIRLRRRNYYVSLALILSWNRQNLEEIEENIWRASAGRNLEDLTSCDVVFNAEVLFILAETQNLRNLPDRAEMTLRRILNAFDSEGHLYANDICLVFLRLSIAYLMLGRFEEGLPCVKNALYLEKGGRRYLLAECYFLLGSYQMALSLCDEALENFAKSLCIFEEKFSDMHPLLGPVYVAVSQNLVRMGQHSQACELSRKGLLLIRSVCPPEDFLVAFALNAHGINLFSSGRHAEAIPVIRESLACLEEGHQEFFTLIAKADNLAHLGLALREENFTLNRNEIIHCLKESVAIVTQINAARKQEFSLAFPCFHLCEVYMKTRQPNEALVTAKMGWDSTKSLPAGNKEKSLMCSTYVQYLNYNGKFDESEELLTRVLDESNHLPPDHPAIKSLQNSILSLQVLKMVAESFKIVLETGNDVPDIFDEDVD